MARQLKSGMELRMLQNVFGYTDKQAADASGVSESTWVRYTNGGKGYENGPPAATVKRFLEHVVIRYETKPTKKQTKHTPPTM